MAAMQTGPRRAAGVRRAASESLGARNRARSRWPTLRAQAPQDVASKDVDGPMTLTEVSQFVRVLCRQREFDRVAWQQTVSASNPLDQRRRVRHRRWASEGPPRK